MERTDDYSERRQHIAGLSDEELKNKFWDLCEKICSPLIEIAKTHTTPSIERSVLLRMGFSSIEAKALVEKVMDYSLMPKGAGHVVFKLAKAKNMDLRQAGLELIDGKHWDDVLALFGKK